MDRLYLLERKAHQEYLRANSTRENFISMSYGDPNRRERLAELERKVSTKAAERRDAKEEYLWAKARFDSLRDMSKFQELSDIYDDILVRHALDIRAVYSTKGIFGGAPNVTERDNLRPHYQALVEAYENQFVHNKGLTDKLIIGFFDSQVHDSLSGFARDATYPSDPRVIYLGGDEKYEYAVAPSYQHSIQSA